MSLPSTQLQVIQLSKIFPDTAEPVQVLQDISFSLSGGEAMAVTGPSGSGKSTLLQILGTLDSPTSGTVLINNRNPFELKEKELARFRNEVVGFVFQEHHLLPQYTVLENVLVPAMAFPGDRSASRERAAGLLERVGMSHRLAHLPAQLSGGERQRVAIARALINRPAILLCDEPTGNLDHDNAGSVADLLFEIHRENGIVLVVVTHSLELAARFPRRAELLLGKIVLSTQ